MLKILCYGVLAGVWFLGGYLLGGWYHKTYATSPQREAQGLSSLECQQQVPRCFWADPHDPISGETIVFPNANYSFPPVYRQPKPNPKLESVMEECIR